MLPLEQYPNVEGVANQLGRVKLLVDGFEAAAQSAGGTQALAELRGAFGALQSVTMAKLTGVSLAARLISAAAQPSSEALQAEAAEQERRENLEVDLAAAQDHGLGLRPPQQAWADFQDPQATQGCSGHRFSSC